MGSELGRPGQSPAGRLRPAPPAAERRTSTLTRVGPSPTSGGYRSYGCRHRLLAHRRDQALLYTTQELRAACRSRARAGRRRRLRTRGVGGRRAPPWRRRLGRHHRRAPWRAVDRRHDGQRRGRRPAARFPSSSPACRSPFWHGPERDPPVLGVGTHGRSASRWSSRGGAHSMSPTSGVGGEPSADGAGPGTRYGFSLDGGPVRPGPSLAIPTRGHRRPLRARRP